MTDIEPRTAKATEAVVRRGQETKAAKLREVGWLVIPPDEVEKAVAALDAIDPDDPEAAHQRADGVLLALAGDAVAKAYRRLRDDRCSWWACA